MAYDGEHKDALARLKACIAEVDHVLPFTGAGISTECGIPDFRSPGGFWSQNKPIPFSLFVASKEARCEAWRRRFAMDAVFADAKPGRGHRALARLVHSCKAEAIVTQNIDDLDHRAGVPRDRITELHGNTTYATCLDCGLRHELAPIRSVFEASGEPPSCRECAGLLKTATISFGQALPKGAMSRAATLCRRCDVLLVIGTSLLVQPASVLPEIAREAGAFLVVINRDPTALDPIADLVVRADIGETLDQVIQT